jgi:hypothetical protein
MKRLKTSFKLNDLPYTLLQRNDVVALYGIGGEFTDKILHWEVSKIYIRKPDKYCNYMRESLPTNEQFGKDDGSQCFNNIQKALEYFDKLTTELLTERELLKGVSKLPLGVGQSIKVIPKVSLV